MDPALIASGSVEEDNIPVWLDVVWEGNDDNLANTILGHQMDQDVWLTYKLFVGEYLKGRFKMYITGNGEELHLPPVPSTKRLSDISPLVKICKSLISAAQVNDVWNVVWLRV